MTKHPQTCLLTLVLCPKLQIKVRVCQRVADPRGGEGDQVDASGVDRGHPRRPHLGVRAAVHPLQLRHHYRSLSKQTLFDDLLFVFKASWLVWR